MSPTQADIRAVRAVLDKQPRLGQIAGDIKSIEVLVRSGSDGLTWYYLETGELSSAAKEVARRGAAIASNQHAIADEIQQLSIPSEDRQNLVTALRAQAAVWNVRSAAWGAPGKPDVDALVTQITRHLQDAYTAGLKARAYLHRDS